MFANEPLETEAVTDLLVRGGGEDEVAGGPKALATERREGDRARSHLALHVERAATPHLAVDEIARPGIALPLVRVGEHGVRVAEERERRAVTATLEPRDEVRALRRPARRARTGLPCSAR